MAQTETIHKGRKIVVETVEGEPQLHIDGQPIRVHHDKEKGTFSTIHVAYKTYSDLTELAKHLIDHSPSFKRPST